MTRRTREATRRRPVSSPRTSSPVRNRSRSRRSASSASVTTTDAVREHHSTGVTAHRTFAPDAVLFAGATEDVVDAVRICHEYRCPVIPFGTGTSTEGQISAEQGGLTIDLSGMNRILRVSVDDQDCTVQAGVTRKALNASLRDTGLFFPVDPGADASLGGMAATRASGTSARTFSAISSMSRTRLCT